MLDIRVIRENPDLVEENARQKGYKVSVEALLYLDKMKRDLQEEVEIWRAKRKDVASRMKDGKPNAELIQKGKEVKDRLAELEPRLKDCEEKLRTELDRLPNMMQPDVPLGGEEDSVEIKTWGNKPTGNVDHLEFALKRDWVDFERGAKVAGAKFYYLKGNLALLENALIQFALDMVVKKGFVFMNVPNMVNSRIAMGTGFAPRSSEQSDEYFIEGEDLSLIATAEMPLTGYHADEIIDEEKLPLLYAGLSPSYRKEAGTYGKHTRGLFRVHQFNKLEMYAFTLPEQSVEMHEKLLAIEEEIWQAIGIPYHIINIAAGDLGAPASKKYDLEYWSKADGKYRELTSCSNCTDFQARNLNIRVRRKDGTVEMLHTLNGTAVSLARSLVAVLEHYQTEDGKLRIPEVLRPYMGSREII